MRSETSLHSRLPSREGMAAAGGIHSHSALGLFPYLFKHAAVNYSSVRALVQPLIKTCFYLSGGEKMYLWTDKKGDTSRRQRGVGREGGGVMLLAAKQMRGGTLVNLSRGLVVNYR